MAVKQCHKKEKKMSERKRMKMEMMWSDLLRRNLKRCDTKKNLECRLYNGIPHHK